MYFFYHSLKCFVKMVGLEKIVLLNNKTIVTSSKKQIMGESQEIFMVFTKVNQMKEKGR